MELLDHSLLAAAMKNLCSPLRNAGDDEDDDSSFDLSDYIVIGDEEPPPAMFEFSAATPVLTACNFEQKLAPFALNKKDNIREGALRPWPKMEEICRVAFRIKTDVEILDDGFKWRKYGKKSVKNRPNNPRNYYRCSTEGCAVKKRVERDQEDRRFVITTYEGIHNHNSPNGVY